ncbi:hypothetical protein ACFSL6_23975 [Paenibacillus thailandensis]|uniref:Uncharacterized protein n=1 Tax=Paenibacillus thailandensis TaxID=393250 RepID=A0ABW5R2B1_9BACL
MNFFEAIERYKSAGDHRAHEMVRDVMRTYDFMQRGMDDLPGPEYYVAFRCLRLLSGKLSTIKYTYADYGLHTKEDSPEGVFAEHVRMLRDWTGIELTVENYPELERYLSRYFVTSFFELRAAYETILGERSSLWMELTREVVDEHWEAIATALSYAFERVDTTRTEKEVVRYINTAVKTDYIRSQFSGLRRVRREGRTRYVEPKYYGPEYAILGTNNGNLGALSLRQRKLYDKMEAIVKEDAKAGRFESYHVDHNGGYRIKNRYVAERLGMHELSVSRALRRMESVI